MVRGRLITSAVLLVTLFGLASCSEEEPVEEEPEAAEPSEIDPVNQRSVLDLRQVTAEREGKRMHFTVIMHRDWEPRDLARPNKLLVHISTDPKNLAYNRFLNITYNGGPVCEFFYSDGDFIGAVPTSRPDDRSVRCTVKTRHLPKWRSHLAWVAETKALPPPSESGRPRIADRAPDSGLYEFGGGIVISE